MSFVLNFDLIKINFKATNMQAIQLINHLLNISVQCQCFLFQQTKTTATELLFTAVFSLLLYHALNASK